MRYRFYNENARQQSNVSALLNFKTFLFAFAGCLGFAGVLMFSNFAAICFAFLVIAFGLKSYRNLQRKRTMFLQFSETGIIYFCEERNEIVYILSRDIVRINNSLSRIEIFTREGFIHTINLLSIESKETRWKIHEVTRSIAKEVSCELAA